MSESYNDILNQIQELFGAATANIDILDETIDIDTQLEYFEHPRDFKELLNDDDIINSSSEIFKKDTTRNRIKTLLVQLASVNNIKAYRTIESYLKNNNTGLNEWATLALHESKMLIKTNILNENAVLISTGLGGEDNRLRYYLVLLPTEKGSFTDFQTNIITSELEFTLRKNNSLLEDTYITEKYYCALCLIPFGEDLRELFYRVIDECNNYGDFLQYDYIINNTKVLSCDEIDKLLAQKHKK